MMYFKKSQFICHLELLVFSIAVLFKWFATVSLLLLVLKLLVAFDIYCETYRHIMLKYCCVFISRVNQEILLVIER